MSPSCIPSWAHDFDRWRGVRISSGCSTIAGRVDCDPEDMVAHANIKLGELGAPIALPIDLARYTLARYIQSEQGSSSTIHKVAVAELAVNRVTLVETSVGNVNNLLLYRSPSKAGYGAYGPIHDSEGASPYGRWASTSQDPCVDDILIADLVLRGKSNLTHLADDQVGPEVEYAAGDPYGRDKNHPVGWGYSSITYYARTAHQYWVGPVPGIDPWSLLMFRTRKDVDYQSDLGKQLIAAGQAAMSDRPSPWTAGHYNRPDWSTTPYCAPGEDSSTEDTGVSTAGLVIGGLLAIAAVGTVAYLGVTGYLGGRVARA